MWRKTVESRRRRCAEGDGGDGSRTHPFPAAPKRAARRVEGGASPHGPGGPGRDAGATPTRPSHRANDPRLYHLILDSTALPLDRCVELIAGAAEAAAAAAVAVARS
jgi:hypothetical protein